MNHNIKSQDMGVHGNYSVLPLNFNFRVKMMQVKRYLPKIEQNSRSGSTKFGQTLNNWALLGGNEPVEL